VAEALLAIHANAELGVSIVWIPMVATDSEAAAREMSDLFRDDRVRQFWDADQACGLAFSQHVFSGWARQAFSDLSNEEKSRATMYVHADTPLEHWPAWDIVLFYEKGIEWTKHPPAPAHWACQHAFYGTRKDGTSGLFWRDNFTTEPFASDWPSEIRRGMAALA